MLAGCGPVARAVPTEDRGGLCLELEPGRPRVLLGEPMVVAASLRNCSKQPRQVVDLIAPAYGFLQVWVTPQDTRARAACRPSAPRDARGKRPRTLAPGEAVSGWVPLHACADGWPLRRAGAYEVSAEFAVEGERLMAPPVSITVELPSEPKQRAAAEAMMAEGPPPVPLLGRGASAEPQRLEGLLRRYPAAPVAPYLRAALGIARADERFDASLKDFRKADCAGAVELLRPSVPLMADPFLSAAATQRLAHCLRSLGREAEAEAAMRDYPRRHPRGSELPGVAQALAGRPQGSP